MENNLIKKEEGIAKRENRKQIGSAIVSMIVIFLLAAYSGYQFSVLNPKEAADSIKSAMESFSFLDNSNPFFTFLLIFLNNALKSLAALLLGFFFGIVPIIFIFTNGQLLGLVIGVLQMKVGLAFAFAGLFPHGIFEIPATILAASYGMWLGWCFWRRLRYGEHLLVQFKFALGRFFKIVIPMLLVAAAIETFIVPHILKLFGKV